MSSELSYSVSDNMTAGRSRHTMNVVVDQPEDRQPLVPASQKLEFFEDSKTVERKPNHPLRSGRDLERQRKEPDQE